MSETGSLDEDEGADAEIRFKSGAISFSGDLAGAKGDLGVCGGEVGVDGSGSEPCSPDEDVEVDGDGDEGREDEFEDEVEDEVDGKDSTSSCALLCSASSRGGWRS